MSEFVDFLKTFMGCRYSTPLMFVQDAYNVLLEQDQKLATEFMIDITRFTNAGKKNPEDMDFIASGFYGRWRNALDRAQQKRI